jgi:2-polyprenyl-3-methyl-5-hydroxy-6-metoxy-1,4-benzoquinol methylase
MLQKVKCNICGSVKHRIFLKNVGSPNHNDKFTLIKCSICGLIYLSPKPTQNKINKYYPEDSYWGINLKEKNDIEIGPVREKLYGNIYKRLLGENKGRIFDVGAGIGLFLTKFSTLGWKTDGCEISAAARNFAQKNFNLKLRSGDFETLAIDKGKYDAVTFINSLEHLYDPKSAIRKAHKILYKQGKIVIVVPNIESLSFALFNKYWIPLQPPVHLYHFSEVTLRRILTENGFDIQWISKWHYTHAYYAFFESIRYFFNRSSYPSSNGSIDIDDRSVIKQNLLKQLMIHGASFICSILVIIEYVLGRGETITVIAKKV